MFELKIVTDFASAYSLRNYPGDCAWLQSYNWQMNVPLYSKVPIDNGFAIDFHEIKKQMKLLFRKNSRFTYTY